MPLVTMVPLKDFVECNQATVTVIDFGDQQYVAQLSPDIAQEYDTWDFIGEALVDYPTTWMAYFLNIGRFDETHSLDCIAFTELLQCIDGVLFKPIPRNTFWVWHHMGERIRPNPNNYAVLKWVENPENSNALEAIYSHLAVTCKLPKH